LVGVASRDDCDLTRPALFTRVSSYLAWINQQISQLTTTTTTTTMTPSIPTTQGTTTPSGGKRNFINLSVLIFVLIFIIFLK
jgi:secreted trypsin-like serine protease